MEHRALLSREHSNIKKISDSPNICEEPSIASHIMSAVKNGSKYGPARIKKVRDVWH